MKIQGLNILAFLLIQSFMLFQLTVASEWDDFKKFIVKEDISKKQKFDVEQGTFSIETKVVNNPTITCYYITPKITNGISPRPPGEVVLYFTFPTENEFYKGVMFKKLAEEGGYTVIGMFFQGHAAKDISVIDHRSYLWGESGSFEAYRTALDQLRTLLHFPSTKVFCYGDSGGGTASQHFAEEYPDLCDGVACLAGQLFVQKNHSTCPILILSTYGDSASTSSVGLENYYRNDTGAVALQSFTQPEFSRRPYPEALFSHCMNDLSRMLVLLFFEGLSELRSKHSGVLPIAESWPMACSKVDYTHLVVPATKRKGLLDDQDVEYMPSREFYTAWISNPLPNKSILLPYGGIIRIASPPPLDSAKDITVYCWRKGNKDIPSPSNPGNELDLSQEVEWDLRQLIDGGHIAMSVEGSPEQANTSIRVHLFHSSANRKLSVCIVDSAPIPSDIESISRMTNIVEVIIAINKNSDYNKLIDPLKKLLIHGIDIHLVYIGRTGFDLDSLSNKINSNGIVIGSNTILTDSPTLTDGNKPGVAVHAEWINLCRQLLPQSYIPYSQKLNQTNDN
jgi:pimeloyl-ACP methyl ester carboxylesterase